MRHCVWRTRGSVVSQISHLLSPMLTTPNVDPSLGGGNTTSPDLAPFKGKKELGSWSMNGVPDDHADSQSESESDTSIGVCARSAVSPSANGQ